MDVGMAALAVAFLSSLSLGFLLCVAFWVMRFSVKIVVGAHAGKVTHECWLFFKVVWVSLCVIVFLYATNHGVFRWFLLAGIIGTCLLTERWLGRAAARVTDGAVSRVRRAVARIMLFLTAPLRAVVRLFGRWISCLKRKIGLRARAICDKIVLQHYDKIVRSRSQRAVRMEVAGLLGGIH